MKREFLKFSKKLAACLCSAAMLMQVGAAVPVMAANDQGASWEAESINFKRHVLNGGFGSPRLIDYERQSGGGELFNVFKDNDLRETQPWYIATYSELTDLANDRLTVRETMPENKRNYYDNNLGGFSEFVWKTTAYDSKMKMMSDVVNESTYSAAAGWVTPTLDTYKIGYPGASDIDHQFFDLCSTDAATIYQNVKTIPGSTFNISMNHAGSKEKAILGVFIGEPMDDGELKKSAPGLPSDTNNGDAFQWMAYLLKENGMYDENAQLPNENTGITDGGFKVYCKDDADWGSVNKDNYKEFVSLEKTDTITHEWACWISQDNATQPGTNGKGGFDQFKTYMYKIPAGQTNSMFAISALSAETQEGVEGVPYKGNIIDNVQFSAHYQVTLSTTYGGWGKAHIPNREGYGKVTYGNPHQTDIIVEDGKAKIYVMKTGSDTKDKFTFSGAYINNVYYPYSDTNSGVWRKGIAGSDNYYVGQGKFADVDLVYDFEMYDMYDIKLIYTAPSTIVFDPNGGTYNDKKDPTVAEISRTNTNVTDDYTLENPTEATEFIGWLPSENLSGNGNGVLVNRGVQAVADTTSTDRLDGYSVTYSLKQGTQQPARMARAARAVNDGNATNTLTKNSTDPGLVFTAQYTYNQSAMAYTKGPHDNDYSENAAGGTVSMAVEDRAPALGYTSTVRSTDTSTDADTKEGDIVVFTAIPKDGYQFDGWYDEKTGDLVKNGKASPTDEIWSYQTSNTTTKLIAKFSAVDETKTSAEIKPYLSCIPQSAEIPVGSIQNGVIYDGTTVGTTDIVGGELYGNSISTGFYVNMNLDNGSYDGCNLKITVPAASETNPVYVKGSSMDGTAVIADEGTVQYGQGTIYKLTTGDVKTKEYRNKIPTVTGGGVVQFGVMFDNIYAPGARATVELYNSASDTTHNGSEDMSSWQQSTDADSFASMYYTQPIE